MAEFSIERAVWAALQPQRPMTLDELQMITGCEASEIAGYLNVLIRNRYAVVFGVKRAASGEAIVLFQLTNPTGPQAPYGDDVVFIDPNLAKPQYRTRQRKPQGPLPTMQGRIRLAAERLGRQFKRHEMITAIGDCGQGFNRGWHRLVWAKELRQTGEDANGLAIYDLAPKTDLGPIREWFRAHLGQPAYAQTLKDDGIRLQQGPHIRMALDMLAAEGYRVSIGGDSTRQRQVYRVDAPAGGTE